MRLLKSKFSIVLSGIGLLIGAAVLFLLFTDQPLVKLLRFTVFNAFEFEGDEVGTVERDIVYKTVAGEPLLVDLYLPFARRHASIPVVVFSHGGGWVMGDRATMLIGPDNKQLILRLRGLGYAVANFEYRLLGETVELADIIADNKDLVRWLKANSDRYDLDPANIGLWGQSAGGYLVLMAGLTDDDKFVGDEGLSGISARVSYIVDNYGPTDLMENFRPIVSGERSPGAFERAQTNHMFGSSYDADPEGFANSLADLSPVTHVDKDDPPVLVLHGDADQLVSAEQSRFLREKMLQAGTEHEVHFITGTDHIFNGATAEQIQEIVAVSTAFIVRNTHEY